MSVESDFGPPEIGCDPPVPEGKQRASFQEVFQVSIGTSCYC